MFGGSFCARSYASKVERSSALNACDHNRSHTAKEAHSRPESCCEGRVEAVNIEESPGSKA